jgi:proline dehydrogenase
LDSTIVGIQQEILFSRQNDQGRTKASSRRARQDSSKKERRRITKYVVKGRSWERDLQELLQEGNMKGQTRDGFLSIKSGVH